MVDIMKINLYSLLDIECDVSTKEIISAYRKKALKCHPDKNPNNPKAAEEFHLLSKALQLLTDASARVAYDKVLKAREAAEIRNRQLDAKRRKLKDDLEARERAATNVSVVEVPTQSLEKEIERLRKEGSKILEQEQKRLAEEIARDLLTSHNLRLKVTWKHASSSYDAESLTKLFEKYGTVTAVVISTHKKGSAIVEFVTAAAARAAFDIESRAGDNPIQLSWLGNKNEKVKSELNIDSGSKPVNNINAQRSEDSNSNLTHKDFESVVLMKLRQAEERKNLIDQMMKDDENV